MLFLLIMTKALFFRKNHWRLSDPGRGPCNPLLRDAPDIELYLRNVGLPSSLGMSNTSWKMKRKIIKVCRPLRLEVNVLSVAEILHLSTRHCFVCTLVCLHNPARTEQGTKCPLIAHWSNLQDQQCRKGMFFAISYFKICTLWFSDNTLLIKMSSINQ